MKTGFSAPRPHCGIRVSRGDERHKVDNMRVAVVRSSRPTPSRLSAILRKSAAFIPVDFMMILPPLPLIARPTARRSLIDRTSPFFCLPFSWALASGQFLRPAASRLLLSRFLPNRTGPSHKAPARLGSSGLSLLSAPGKWGKKKEKISCLTYMLSGIASGRGLPAYVSDIRAWVVRAGHSRSEDLRRWRRHAYVVAEGVASDGLLGESHPSGYPCKSRRVFEERSWMRAAELYPLSERFSQCVRLVVVTPRSY